MFHLLTKKQETSSEFSRFIRTASVGEKKKVFKRVLDKATQDQKKIMEKV